MNSAILKFTAPLHPPNSIITKKSQTHHPNFVKITNKKVSHITSCSKKNNTNSVLKAAAPVSSSKDVPKFILTDDDMLHVTKAVDAICSVVKQVISPVINLFSPPEGSSFVVEGDLILFEQNGTEIIGEVKHVVHHEDTMEVSLLCERGLENFTINRQDILNLTTPNEHEENMWRIYTSVECMDDGVMKMVREIKKKLNAHDELKSNLKYNLVTTGSTKPGAEIEVICLITCSKLRTPRFDHYMKVRKTLLSEIDEIRRKHGGSNKENSVLSSEV